MTESVPFLPYGRQALDAADVAAVVEVLNGDWLTTGPAVERFEQAASATLDCAHAISCSSGTAALHLAALALGVGPGDTVVVPTMTMAATANAVRLTGADVAFADADADTGLMTPDTFAAAIEAARGQGRGVTAALPVHLNGQCCDMPAIAEIAAREGIKLVEDACHAIGGLGVGGSGVGSCRDSAMAAFSLHPVKTITGGEGGIVATNDDGLAHRLRLFRNHGMTRDPDMFTNAGQGFDADGTPNPWYYEILDLGLNYRLSDIHAALAGSQLAKLEDFVERRRHLAGLYDRALPALAPGIRPISRMPDQRPGWHLYSVLCDFDAIGKSRAVAMRELRDRGIGTQVHYLPVHRQPYYEGLYGKHHMPGADRYYARQLSLPLFPAMADADVDRVVDALRSVCGP